MSSLLAGMIPVALSAGCGADAGALDDDTGSAVASITSVPTGVQCVRIVARGVTRNFAVTGGVSSVLNLGPQPSGSLLVSGQAYNVACGSVTTATVATWVSEAVTVTVVAGLTANVDLTMRPNAPTNVSVDFVAPATSIALGNRFALAVLADGTVRAWGDNSYGQLGDGTTTQQSTPVRVSGLGGVRQVAAGATHACAVLSNGQAWCWGSDLNGMLGSAMTTQSSTPRQVTLPTGVSLRQISAGDNVTCGVDTSSAVWCWGRGALGQMGDFFTEDRTLPVRVQHEWAGYPLFAVEVSVGHQHVFARAANTRTYCWGSNTRGECGFGYTSTTTTNAARESRFLGVAGVRTASLFTCALTMARTVECAGYNGAQSLGDGTYIDSAFPVTVAGLTDVLRVSSGGNSSCAVLADGTAWCWGYNFSGQLGSLTTRDLSAPTRVYGLNNVVEVVAGNSESCARLSDGTVWCWGSNDFGELGDGTMNWRFAPGRVLL